MSPTNEQVIEQFNEYINMTKEELTEWLGKGDSQDAGWTGGSGEGETVGHESGRKIVSILEHNPGKDPSKYSESDLEHMRRVCAYCKRHLAQEDHLKETKTPEELAKMRSTLSLKNWGHDPVKAMKQERGASDGEGKDTDAKKGEDADEAQAKDIDVADGAGDKDTNGDGDEAETGEETGDGDDDSEPDAAAQDDEEDGDYDGKTSPAKRKAGSGQSKRGAKTRAAKSQPPNKKAKTDEME